MNKGKKENNNAPIPIEIEELPNTTEEVPPVLPKPQTLSQDHEKLCCTKENQMPRASINHPTQIKGENLEQNDRQLTTQLLSLSSSNISQELKQSCSNIMA